VTELNNLFDRALTHVAFMPYAYIMDKFKWDVLSEKVKEEDLNCHWVKMRMDVQGEL
jgi:peptidyl-dipeptidase A